MTITPSLQERLGGELVPVVEALMADFTRDRQRLEVGKCILWR